MMHPHAFPFSALSIRIYRLLTFIKMIGINWAYFQAWTAFVVYQHFVMIFSGRSLKRRKNLMNGPIWMDASQWERTLETRSGCNQWREHITAHPDVTEMAEYFDEAKISPAKPETEKTLWNTDNNNVHNIKPCSSRKVNDQVNPKEVEDDKMMIVMLDTNPKTTKGRNYSSIHCQVFQMICLIPTCYRWCPVIQ